MTRTLCAFSGGLDSTWLAYRVLTETDDELHLFWMDFSNLFFTDRDGNQKRYYNELLPAEKIVGPRIVEWLNVNVRKVTFETIEGVEPDPLATQAPGATARSWRVIPMLRVAADLCAKSGYERFIYARSPENVRTPGQEKRWEWFYQFWESIAPKGVTFETPLIKDWQGRPHAIAGLPPELLALALPCNNPLIVNGEPQICNVCDKCFLTAEARKQLEKKNAKPDKILDDLLKKRQAGQYIGNDKDADAKFNQKPYRFPPFEVIDVVKPSDNPVPIPSRSPDKPGGKP